MTTKILIKNGTISDPSLERDFRGDILVDSGKIKKISEETISTEVDETVDAEGMFVAPGFIDMHVHFRDPGYEYKEDIISGLESAAAGGFTAVCPMPNTKPVADNAGIIKYMNEKAEKGNGVRLFPIAAATESSAGKTVNSFKKLKNAGAVAVSDDGNPIRDTSVLRSVMECAREFDMIYISHSEDQTLSSKGHMNEGQFSNMHGIPGIPVVAEASMVARECMLSLYLDIPVHIAHVSCEMSVDILKMYKDKGAEVTAETTPHYLTLTDEAVGRHNAYAKINPPLRTETDRKSIIKAIQEGIIDVVATDHAPHHESEKNVKFCEALPGIIGMETALPLLLKLYHEGQLSIRKIIKLFTKGYEIMNIPGGFIREGDRADLTIFDPEHQWTVDKNMFLSRSRNTPFDGMDLKGSVFYTIAGGKKVFSGKF